MSWKARLLQVPPLARRAVSWKARSFEVLPALRLGRQPLRSALNTVTVAWMFGIAWMSCITGSQMTSFLRLLGFSNSDLGLYSAIPYLATVGQLYAAVVLERTGLRKYMFVYYACVHRLLWLVIALIPLLVAPGKLAVSWFLLVYLTSCLLANLSTPPWYDWMGSLIPRRIRGRYLANRQLWTLPIQLVMVMLIGVLLDMLTPPPVLDAAGKAVAAPPEPGSLLAIAISAIFAVGAVLGTVDILLFLRLREIVSPALVRPRPAHRKNLRHRLKSLLEPAGVVRHCLQSKLFVHYAGFWALIMFSISVCDQFYYTNAMEKIGFSKSGTNFLFIVIGGLSSWLLVRPWGALLDRWGRRPVLILATAGGGGAAWPLVRRIGQERMLDVLL